MKDKTTKEHFEKYEAMAKYCELYEKYSLASKAYGYSRTALKKLYKVDNNLNFIPLTAFDVNYRTHADKNMPQSMAENVCMQKHALLYYFMELKPEFN